MPVPRRQGPLREAPPPLQLDTVRVVLAGIGIWTAALVVLLVLGDRVDRLWTWTCVAAIALAGLGLFVMRLQGQIPPRGHDQTQSERTSNSEVS